MPEKKKTPEKTVHDVMKEIQAIEDLTVNNHGESSRIMLEEFYNMLNKYLVALVAIADPAGYHKVIKGWHALIAKSIELAQKEEGLEKQICQQMGLKPGDPNYQKVYEAALEMKVKGTQDMLDDIAMDYARIVKSDQEPVPIKITKTKAKKAAPKKKVTKGSVEELRDGYYDGDGNFISV